MLWQNRGLNKHAPLFVCTSKQVSFLASYTCVELFVLRKRQLKVCGVCMSACCGKVLGEEKGVMGVYVVGCYIVNRSARYLNPLDVCLSLPITKQEELKDLCKEGNCSYTATLWQTSNRGVYSWKLMNQLGRIIAHILYIFVILKTNKYNWLLFLCRPTLGKM